MVRGRSGARARNDGLRDDPGQPIARAAQHRPRRAAQVGPRAVPCRAGDPARPSVCTCGGRLRPCTALPRRLVRRTPCRTAESRARRARRRRRRRRSSGARRHAARQGRGVRARAPRCRPSARGLAVDRAAGPARTRAVLREANAQARLGVGLVIVTVTMNAAIDRSLDVPNFQPGQRHRASSGFTQAGGKGINVARALKRLDVPVIATGLAGGRTGTRIIEELTNEGILNDFVRIGDESRTSTMVIDDTAGTTTEIYEWGPEVRADELTIFFD